MRITIYHNPKCSKSREALKLLEGKDCELEVINYIQLGLTHGSIKEIQEKLKLNINDFLRHKEESYKSANIDWKDNEMAIKGLIVNPQVLERPIVICGDKAIIARPPELVLELF